MALADAVVLLTQKLFISVSFPLHLINKKCACHLCREFANENKQYKATKILIYNSHLTNKALKDMDLNRALLSLHGVI